MTHPPLHEEPFEMVPKGELVAMRAELEELRGRVAQLEGLVDLAADEVPGPDGLAQLHANFRTRAREIEARRKD